MEKIFGSQNTLTDSGDHWFTVSDLMAGLMGVFLVNSYCFYDDNLKRKPTRLKMLPGCYPTKFQGPIYESL